MVKIYLILFICIELIVFSSCKTKKETKIEFLENVEPENAIGNDSSSKKNANTIITYRIKPKIIKIQKNDTLYDICYNNLTITQFLNILHVNDTNNLQPFTNNSYGDIAKVKWFVSIYEIVFYVEPNSKSMYIDSLTKKEISDFKIETIYIYETKTKMELDRSKTIIIN